MGKQPSKSVGKTKKATSKSGKIYRATQSSTGSRRSPIQGSPFINPLQNTYQEESPPPSFYYTQIPANRRSQPPNQPPNQPHFYVNQNPYMHPNVQYMQQPQPQQQPQQQRIVVSDLNGLLNVSYTQGQLDALAGQHSPVQNRSGLYRQFNDNYHRGGRSKKYSRRNRRK